MSQAKVLYSLSFIDYLKYTFYSWSLYELIQMIPQDQYPICPKHEYLTNASQQEALAKPPSKKYHCKKYNPHSHAITFVFLLSSAEILPLIQSTSGGL